MQASTRPCVPVHRVEVRSLAYWLARHPPGWISRHAAEDADPLQLAGEIQLLSAEFVVWLHLPPRDRWDDGILQKLSAAIFNRYRRNEKESGENRDVDLLDLGWPAGTTDVRTCLIQMRELLAGPLAVFKALRSAVARDTFPSPDDVRLADATLLSSCTALGEATRQLRESLEPFRSLAAKKSHPSVTEQSVHVFGPCAHS